MSKVSGEEIERFNAPKVEDILRVTIDQGNNKYVEKYVQQITSKTIVVIWSHDKLIQFDLNGVSRGLRSQIFISPESLTKVQSYLAKKNISRYNSGFKPTDWSKVLMTEKPKLEEKFADKEYEDSYIRTGMRVIKCTVEL